MTHIDDENIKKIIKENVSKPEIKLSAGQIMARFHERNQVPVSKRRMLSFPQVKIGLGFLSAALVIGSVLYFNREMPLPPITSSSETSISVPTSETRHGNKVAGGKEGEFIFMSTSSLLYAPNANMSPDLKINAKHDSAVVIPDQILLEETLDQTLPLVDDFYMAGNGYQYQKHQGGAYHGQYGTYTSEYIISDTIRLIANIELEDDDDETESEITGELIHGDISYRIEGEKEVDHQKGETDLSLKIEYSDDSYLEISSENEHDEQTFTYDLVLDGEVILSVEIEGYTYSHKTERFVSVDVFHVGREYHFEIERRKMKYFIEYESVLITAFKNEENQYIYSYKNR
jgi:hypothetical protein